MASPVSGSWVARCVPGPCSLLFIDIDDFKDINDSLGHAGGDALLIQLATRLKGCVRARDTVARLGGDEFAIVIDDEEECAAPEIAERILRALDAPFIVNGNRVAVTASIGVAEKSPETEDSATLLRHADFAMYTAKGAGKARYQLFDAQMYAQLPTTPHSRQTWPQPSPAGQLRLEYQPVADLRSGQILGLEALVRWEHPTLGVLDPAQFIPLAEETGDIDAIGCWIIETLSRQAANWRQNMNQYENLWIAVNLSSLQLPSPRNLAAIKRILADPWRPGRQGRPRSHRNSLGDQRRQRNQRPD